jgi:prepilin-type N-terminal cleavage/methylation domain-containing protein/prepilin-type processing-associated H-X9-DG protein
MIKMQNKVGTEFSKRNPSQAMRNKSGAFTLIELLVVIAIIAILAAILFPVFARARENARRASCQSNEKNLVLSIMQYTQDYDERMPNHWPGGVDTKLQWINTLQPYVKNYQVFFCPSASGKNSGAAVSSANMAYGYNWAYLNNVALAAITSPTETLLLADTGLNATAYVINIPAHGASRQPNDIHLEGCNFAFVDGHVKWMKATPIINLTTTNYWDLN